MPLPTERQLLDLWERGFAAPTSVRAGALLTLSGVAPDADAVAGLTLGQRERALLTLRRALLGTRMAAVADCPQCGERHDVEFDVDLLLADASSHVPAALEVHYDDLILIVRPLTVADYAAAAAATDATSAADMLVARCTLTARRDTHDVAVGTLPHAARAAISAALAHADPLCELSTQLHCAACGRQWTAALDTAAYLWRELHAWAERLLRQVHALASAYGWTEAEVLQLSPWRRAAYVALAGH